MNTCKQFSAILNDWREWQSEASSLRRAAQILRQEAQRNWDDKRRSEAMDKGTYNFPPDLVGVIALLNGLAIENLLKGLWVKTNNPVVVVNGNLINELKTHKVITLIKDVNLKGVKFTLSDEERDLMVRLEKYVKWAGRYPIPKHSQELDPQPLQDGTKFPLCFRFNYDENLISSIIKRLETLLNT
ncbi:MAG: hypothetical protein ACLPT6_02390 [Desulfobaccales bacterium]